MFRTLALATALLVPSLATAQDAPGDIAAARRAQMSAMQLLAYHAADEGAGTDETTFYRLTEEATAIAAILAGLPALFPDGSGPADLPEGATQAAPAVWEDRDGFLAALGTAREAAEAAAFAADPAAFMAAMDDLDAACSACHAEYLAYDPFAALPGGN
ncbi:cytochrome c [Rhodobacterales bacterium HKCCE2091]|nr:cytochrome c [Rhodobacterales bacterium HKCCE2091]